MERKKNSELRGPLRPDGHSDIARSGQGVEAENFKSGKEDSLQTKKNNQVEKFMSLVNPEPNTGCWIWGGYIRKNGYGSFVVHDEQIKISLAHRASYYFFVGEIGFKHVLHRCDNRWCVNPEHLFLGTAKDNMMDMAKKMRCPQSKIPNDGLADILKRTNAGESSRSISLSFNCSGRAIRYAIWRAKEVYRIG